MPDNKILQNLLSGVVPSRYNPTEKVLAFFKLAIDLERSKEPDIREYHEYPINYKNDKLMLVDFPCNPQFNDIFSKNRDSSKTKFPNDLYVGLQVITDNQAFRLLNFIISFEDIKDIDVDNQLLPIRISNFEINIKEASRLELTPEKIEKINNDIKANPTMKGLRSLMRSEISEDAKIPDTLFLALSTKSIELSQIYSELNNKRLSHAVNTHLLLNAFLNYKGIDNVVDSVDVDELLQITQLDEFQKKAVALALNSKVSVITGPPGTGKTQVIENILANTLLKGKKVLVASKNNKAVDNVKDRFDEIDRTGYLVRFGAKKLIGEQTKPEIQRVLNEIARLSDNSSEYAAITQGYNNAVKDIRDSKAQLARKAELSVEVPTLQSNLHNLQTAYNQLLPQHESKIANIENTFSSVASLKDMTVREMNECMTSVKRQYNVTTSKFTGAFSFWYNWFSKKKYAMLLLNLIETMPYHLKDQLRGMNLKSDVADFKSYDDMAAFCRSIMEVLEKGISFRKQLDVENSRYQSSKTSSERSISSAQQILSTKQNELEGLCGRESELKSKMENAKNWIATNSLKLLGVYIKHNKLQQRASEKINSYLPYIPDSIPFKDMEYETFKRRAKDFIDVFKLCAVTSLSSKNAFPLSEELFDMVIIDEASQCDIASALPLIMRAKQLVVIGDPMQLKHISSVRVDEENEIKKALQLDDKAYIKYAECSLWDYCQGFVSASTKGTSSPLMLQCHYRCHPDIIGYSNNMFYSGRMGCALQVKTDISRFRWKDQGIRIYDIKGKQTNDNVNINEKEANAAIQIATAVAAKDDKVTIGIVTPFRHQAERINSLIPNQYQNRIEANTVHKYQGDEKDVMIYSLVVTSNSPEKKIKWIDYSVPNLVNVAVTRAKSALYVVCDVDYIKSKSRPMDPLGNLVRYKA